MAISNEVRQAGLAAIRVAAAMLLEDAHEAVIASAGGDEQGMALAEAGEVLAERLDHLGGDLAAFAGAAAVFARQD